MIAHNEKKMNWLYKRYREMTEVSFKKWEKKTAAKAKKRRQGMINIVWLPLGILNREGASW